MDKPKLTIRKKKLTLTKKPVYKANPRGKYA